MASPSGIPALWQRMNPRERFAVLAALSVIAAAALWLWGVAPALRTIRQAPAQHAAADTQLANMRNLAAQAASMRGANKLSADEALRALDNLVKQHLGSGSSLVVVGEQATVTLKAVGGPQLVEFVQSARAQARALPAQVSIQRSAPSATSTAVLWDGRMTLTVYAGH